MKPTSPTINEFERASLRSRIERSCVKNNNGKNKLVAGLWKHLNIMSDKRPLKEAIDLSESTKEMKNFFHRDDNEITWIIVKHHN